MKAFLKRDKAGQLSLGRWENLIQFLIILSLITYAIETLPNLSPILRTVLGILETITILIFTVEYLLRLILGKPRWSYARSFFGIIDLVAIAPFYLAIGMDLRSIRTFHLFRVLRVLKLARYSAAIRRFKSAFNIAKEELILFGIASLIVLYLSSVGIYFFEYPAQPDKYSSVFHCAWWAIATLTTVGYGDIYPITMGGRIFTFFVLAVGVGVVAVPSGLIASALARVRDEEQSSKKRKNSPSKDDVDP